MVLWIFLIALITLNYSHSNLTWLIAIDIQNQIRALTFIVFMIVKQRKIKAEVEIVRWNQFARGKNRSRSVFIKIIQECLWMMMIFIICVHLFAFILLLNALRFIVFVKSCWIVMSTLGTFETSLTEQTLRSTNYQKLKVAEVRCWF